MDTCGRILRDSAFTPSPQPTLTKKQRGPPPPGNLSTKPEVVACRFNFDVPLEVEVLPETGDRVGDQGEKQSKDPTVLPVSHFLHLSHQKHS